MNQDSREESVTGKALKIVGGAAATAGAAYGVHRGMNSQAATNYLAKDFGEKGPGMIAKGITKYRENVNPAINGILAKTPAEAPEGVQMAFDLDKAGTLGGAGATTGGTGGTGGTGTTPGPKGETATQMEFDLDKAGTMSGETTQQMSFDLDGLGVEKKVTTPKPKVDEAVQLGFNLDEAGDIISKGTKVANKGAGEAVEKAVQLAFKL